MSRPRRNKCAPSELLTWAVGLPEAAALGGLVALILSILLDWRWGAGVLWGVGEIALGRAAAWAFYPALKDAARVGMAAGLMAAARLLLYAGLAFLGIHLSLAPLGICVGLLLPGIVLKMRLLFSL